MTDVRQRLADALVQAAMEGDDSPKVTVSMRVLELIQGSSHLPAPPPPSPSPSALNLTPEALKEALDMPGRSQSALARFMKIEASAVNRMCQGTREIKVREAQQIASYLSGDPGQRLRARRKQLNMSSQALAQKVGVSASSVRGHENGQNGIPRDMAPKYAEALGVTPAWLLFGDEPAGAPADED